jgi:predicted ATP-binding protein involved in virulence
LSRLKLNRRSPIHFDDNDGGKPMYIEAISIKRFRSIREVELTNCGGLNVLIGKNNAGKSAILSAIEAFFISLGKCSVVNIAPAIGKEIDFFEKDTAQLIVSRPHSCRHSEV